MAEFRTATYETHLENGEKVSYEIRGLEDNEIEDWAAFCASVFGYKANPPPASYFARHYHNDPSRVASLIRVAFYQEKMVASCRLFLRTVSMAGTPLSAGGVGEVCTANNHRRLGLSKALLQNVIEIMKERKLQVSLLHAAPWFFPVYEKAGGYVCTTSQWSVVSVVPSKLSEALEHLSGLASRCKIRKASFPKDTDQLSTLHQMYSERRFVGCIVRSKDYWNNYISVELKGSLWVLENPQGAIVAWLSIRPRGDRFQLREFGYDNKQSSEISISEALALLLGRATEDNSVTEEWSLTVPAIVLNDCKSSEEDRGLSFVDWSHMTKVEDLGWMYKILDSGKISIESLNGSQTPHLIWPADSF